MVEIELRAKTTPEIVKIIQQVASKVHELQEHDKYFKFEDDIQRRLIIRLRKNDRGTFLTFKGSSVLQQDVAWQEWEQPVNDLEALEHLFLSNGLVLVTEIIKHRITYTYNDITLNLDTIKNLGTFVELELISDNPELAQKKLKDTMKHILHLSEDAIITKGYVKLMLKE